MFPLLDPWKMAVASVTTLLNRMFSFYWPVYGLIVASLWLSGIDVVLGLVVAKKIKKEPICANKFLHKLHILGLFWGILSSMLIAAPALEAIGYAPYSGAAYTAVMFVFYELLSITEKLGLFGLKPAKKVLIWLGKKDPL